MPRAPIVTAPGSVWSAGDIKKMIDKMDSQSFKRTRRLIQLFVEGGYPEVTDADRCTALKHALKLIIKKGPHDQQVETLFELLFKKRDILLIAKTGFGKSCLFHTPSLLLNKITLIVTPLTKLGEEQMEDINKIQGAKACIIDAETKRRDHHLLQRVEQREYTHVILSPEQIMSDEFKKVLKQPAFINEVCLVAIDEAHLIENWKDFREDYTHLESLRRWLPFDVPMFCCSGTMSSRVEADVRKYSGLREEGSGPHSLKTIRTSVDRPELTIVLNSMQKFSDFSPLLFIFNDCEPDVKHIPKTVVFMDDHSMVHAALEYLREAASRKGFSPDAVSCFTSRIAEEDKKETYGKFKKEGGDIRIIVATTSLGMGMNIPDIEIVIQWDKPISEDIGDLWQRFGRSARSPERSGTVYAFLPVSLFQEKKSNKRKATVGRGQALGAGKKPRTMRNMMSGTRRDLRTDNDETAPSQSQMQMPVPFTPLPSGRQSKRKTRSQTAAASQAAFSWSQPFAASQPFASSQAFAASQMPPPLASSQALAASQMPPPLASSQMLPPLTPFTPGIMEFDAMSMVSGSVAMSAVAMSVAGDPKDAAQDGECLAPEQPANNEKAIAWRLISSCDCYRKGILLHLQEEVDEQRDKTRCCNACNPNLNPTSQMEQWPIEGAKESKPGSTTRAGMALSKIRKWCQEQGKRLRLLDDKEYSMIPSELYLPTNLQRKAAQLFNNAKLSADLELLQPKEKATLVEKFKPDEWEYIDREGEAEKLIDFLYSIRKEVAHDFAAKSSNRRKKTATNAQGAQATQNAPQVHLN